MICEYRFVARIEGHQISHETARMFGDVAEGLRGCRALHCSERGDIDFARRSSYRVPDQNLIQSGVSAIQLSTRTSGGYKCLVVFFGQVFQPVLRTGGKKIGHAAGLRGGPDARVGRTDESTRHLAEGQRAGRSRVLQRRRTSLPCRTKGQR